MNNFWQKLSKPIYALAPMAGITDSAFRQICKIYGADVVYSEMASAAGLVYNPQKTLGLLRFSEIERPYVVQLFGAKPEHFASAVALIEKKINPDGIDINLGCPVKKVRRQGAGAVLMDNLKLAREIVIAVINNTSLPVSIKIRGKAVRTDALKFLDYLADLDIKAVMIHGRTLAQGMSGQVNWKIIQQSRYHFVGIILANGGVKCAEDAENLLAETGADGIGIGQGALGRPWIFQQLKISATSGSASGGKNYALRIKNSGQKSINEIFQVMLKHARLVNKLKGERGIVEMRKHWCWYVGGLPKAAALRQKLVEAESLKDIKSILLM